GASAERAHHRQMTLRIHLTGHLASARLRAEAAPLIERIHSLTFEREPDLLRRTARAWLDAEHEFAGQKSLAIFVQQQRVDAVAKWEVHSGGDEDVVPAVTVEILHTRSPRPVSLDAPRVGYLGVTDATGTAGSTIAASSRSSASYASVLKQLVSKKKMRLPFRDHSRRHRRRVGLAALRCPIA